MKQSRAFTLIELIVTVVIAAIALYSLLTVFMTVSARNVDQEAVSVALYLANSRLEEISSKSFGYISSEALTSCGSQFASYASRVVVDFVSGEALDATYPLPTSYKRVLVQITSDNLPGTIEVSTLVTDISND